MCGLILLGGGIAILDGWISPPAGEPSPAPLPERALEDANPQSPLSVPTYARFEGKLTIASGAVGYNSRIQGYVHLPPGTFGLVTIWSDASDKDYPVQVISQSGPFDLSVTYGLPESMGDFEARLWAISPRGAEHMLYYENNVAGTCSEGIASLSNLAFEGDSEPFRLVHQVHVERLTPEAAPPAEWSPENC